MVGEPGGGRRRGLIEYRRYDGGAEEAAEFTRRVWSSAFRGRVTVPLWDAAFFEWALLAAPSADRHLLVAAYDGGRMVGCLFARPVRFRLCGSEAEGALCSWLTVEPGYQGQGVAQGMVAELRRRMRERGCRFVLGFGIPGPGSKGIRFWARFRGETVLGRRVYWWAYALDPRAVARSESALLRRLGARLLVVAHRSSRYGSTPACGINVRIRGYGDEDLAGCLAIVGQSSQGSDLSYCWTAEALAHQLSYENVPQTLVAVQNDRVVGLLNYYGLGLCGRGEFRASIIDHFACRGLPVKDQVRLLRVGLAAMRRSGAQVALTSRLSGASVAVLLVVGFLPMWPGLRPVFFSLDPCLPFRAVRTLRVHVR